ncbi:MAG: Rieske 2Fe-2S domain-containing protein [Defluviicoccus sp.]|nr:Rieske 2Fe-2S domain-containing protein [Defluviicoccus sp.]
MDGTQTREQRIDHRLATGIRNRWWCIGPSAMVQDTPVALTRLGEKLVAWRDQTGKVNLVADRCPHRAAALSMGKVIEGRLTCRYHGVQVGGDGRILDVPAFPGCELVGRELVTAYPTVEHFQAIWAWFGDESHAEPPPIDLPEELTSPEWTGFLVSTTWHGNYQYVLDNFVDIMHPPATTPMRGSASTSRRAAGRAGSCASSRRWCRSTRTPASSTPGGCAGWTAGRAPCSASCSTTSTSR